LTQAFRLPHGWKFRKPRLLRPDSLPLGCDR